MNNPKKENALQCTEQTRKCKTRSWKGTPLNSVINYLDYFSWSG